MVKAMTSIEQNKTIAVFQHPTCVAGLHPMMLVLIWDQEALMLQYCLLLTWTRLGLIQFCCSGSDTWPVSSRGRMCFILEMIYELLAGYYYSPGLQMKNINYFNNSLALFFILDSSAICELKDVPGNSNDWIVLQEMSLGCWTDFTSKDGKEVHILKLVSSSVSQHKQCCAASSTCALVLWWCLICIYFPLYFFRIPIKKISNQKA